MILKMCFRCNSRIISNECICLTKDEWDEVRNIKSQFVGADSRRRIAMHVWRTFFDLKNENSNLNHKIDSMYASKPEEILRAVNASSAQFERKIKEMETDLNTLKRINAQLRVRVLSGTSVDSTEDENNAGSASKCPTCCSSTTCYCP